MSDRPMAEISPTEWEDGARQCKTNVHGSPQRPYCLTAEWEGIGRQTGGERNADMDAGSGKKERIDHRADKLRAQVLGHAIMLLRGALDLYLYVAGHTF